MAATHGVGTYGNAVGTVTPLDHKMANLSHWVKTAANTIRSGVLWDGNATVVSGTANMSYNIRALTAVLSRGATAGAVELSNDAIYNVITTAAPGSNSRYDVPYLWQREYSIDGTDSNPVIGVVQGTAAASPTVPSLAAFPGAIALAQILVPAGVTATNSGTTITQTAPFTASAGGVVMFRNLTERDANVLTDGTLGAIVGSSALYKSNGAAWSLASPAPGLLGVIPSSVSGTGVSVSAGGAVTASAMTAATINGIFSSAASNYKIVFDGTFSSTGYLTCQLSIAGTAQTTGYAYNVFAPTGADSGAAVFWQISAAAAAATGGGSGEITFFGPAKAATTRYTATTTTTTASNVQKGGITSGYMSTTTPRDGVVITCTGGGTFTGTFRVYKYDDLV